MKINSKIRLDTIFEIMIYIYICAVYFLKYQVLYIELIFLAMNFIRSFKVKWEKNFYLIWSIIFLFSLIPSFVNSVNLKNSVTVYIQLIKMIFLGNILIQVINTKKEIQTYRKAIIVAGYLMIIYVYFKTQTSFFHIFSKRFGSNEVVNANDIALKLCVSANLLLQNILSKKIKMKSLILFNILVIFIFLTGSKKGFIFIIVSILLEILFIRYRKKTKIIYDLIKYFPILIISGAFIINKITKLDILVVDRLLKMFSKTEKDRSTLDRIEMIKEGIKFFKEDFIFGNGLGNYKFLSKFELYSHNNYIELLVGVGIIGCIIYYIMSIYLILKNSQYYKKYEEFVPFFIIMLILPIMDIGLVRYNERFYNLIIVLNFVMLLKVRKNKKEKFRKNREIEANTSITF